MDVTVGRTADGRQVAIPQFDWRWSELKRLQWRAGYTAALHYVLVEIEEMGNGEYRVLINDDSKGIYDYVDACRVLAEVGVTEAVSS